MNKKQELDHNTPVDDVECWSRYPKHRWVYETGQLLTAQNIAWSPFKTSVFDTQVPARHLYSTTSITENPGSIYIEKPPGTALISEAYITKGEIKYIRHIDPKTGEQLPLLVGEVELRLNAVVSLYFSKFTGVISCHSTAQDIYRIYLRAQSELGFSANATTTRLNKRIYKKNDLVSVSGLTDQVAQESIAS